MVKRYMIVKVHPKNGHQKFFTGFAGSRGWTTDSWRAKHYRCLRKAKTRSVQIFHETTPVHHLAVYEIVVHYAGGPVYLSMP